MDGWMIEEWSEDKWGVEFLMIDAVQQFSENDDDQQSKQYTVYVEKGCNDRRRRLRESLKGRLKRSGDRKSLEKQLVK